jgi:phage terminase Nu1 subunit (DNA packaging protein)
MKIPQVVVSTAKLAAHFKLSPRRIQQLVKLGLPKLSRGKFDYVEAAKFYIRFLQRALEAKGAEVGDGTLELFRSQKARSLNATAALKELELKNRRAEVVTIAEASDVLADFARIVRARFSTLPSSLAGQLLNQTSRTMIQAIVETSIRDACCLLASTDAPTVSEKRQN